MATDNFPNRLIGCSEMFRVPVNSTMLRIILQTCAVRNTTNPEIRTRSRYTQTGEGSMALWVSTFRKLKDPTVGACPEKTQGSVWSIQEGLISFKYEFAWSHPPFLMFLLHSNWVEIFPYNWSNIKPMLHTTRSNQAGPWKPVVGAWRQTTTPLLDLPALPWAQSPKRQEYPL